MILSSPPPQFGRGSPEHFGWPLSSIASGGFPAFPVARQVAASLAAMRNKTDRNDAHGLAQTLRTGWYRTVHVKSLESHQVRALLSSRKMILTKCIDLENELRGLLKVFGVRLPPRVGHGGFDERVRPKVLALPELAKCLLPLLDARSTLYRT